MTTPNTTPETAAQTLTCFMVEYDIPVGTMHQPNPNQPPRPFPNPSGRLRRIGFRATLSCWVIPEHALPHNLINEMRSLKCEVNLVKFDASEGPRLIRMAQTKIKAEVDRQIASAALSLDAAADRHLLPDSEITGERDAAQERFERAASIIQNRLNRLISDVEQAIQNFGVTPTQLGIEDFRKAHGLFQQGILARCEEYASATNALRQVGTADATALAAAAAADEAPAYAMSDMLRDAGNEKAADTLAAVFAEPDAGAEETVPPADEDDGTFSLGDLGDE
jgi:hypothetical protein